jgi:hypothetical protein
MKMIEDQSFHIKKLNIPTSLKLKDDNWRIPNNFKKILLIISKSIYDNHIYISLLEKKYI